MKSAGPTPGELTNFLKNKSNPSYVNVSDRENHPFPVKLSTTDPEDAKWALRKSAISNEGQTAAGLAVAPDSFFDYIDRKKQAELLADYEAWVMANADLSKPETTEFWYRTVPWIREKRLQVIEEQADLQKQIARIQVDGPKSEDDLKLIFAVKNGLVKISNKPLYELGSSTNRVDDSAVATNFTAGLFNPYSTFFMTGGTQLSRNIITPGNNSSTIGLYDFNAPTKDNAGTVVLPLRNAPTSFNARAVIPLNDQR